jgi:hypothetical protein
LYDWLVVALGDPQKAISHFKAANRRGRKVRMDEGGTTGSERTSPAAARVAKQKNFSKAH